MKKADKIYIAGHKGLVGSHILDGLKQKGYSNLLFRTHSELDLTRQSDVEAFFKSEQPEYVFIAAAKVGGIGANSTFPADFIQINLSIALNIVHSAYNTGVKKLLNLGSSCIYPKLAPQPLKEEYLLTGLLEPTNEPYAIAKIAAIKLCSYYNKQHNTNFLSIMPTNLYGPGDNYNLELSHVLPAFMNKLYKAKIEKSNVLMWGDGSPLREFLYAPDLADAAIFLMENYDAKQIGEFVNIGTGKEISIKDLAILMAEIIGFSGNILWDPSKPNGTPRKLLDISRMKKLGWQPKTGLREGIEKTYRDYLNCLCK